MTDNTHLTNNLQAELDKIGSTVRLQSDNNSFVKMNDNEWAFAIMNSRSIEAATCVGLTDKHLQLEEKGVIACTSSTKSILEMAIIIDKWLEKQFDVFQLTEQHNIEINKIYMDLKTLTIDEILELRWTYYYDEIVKEKISFRKDVFEEFSKHFSFLYPTFSHDNLLFSNVIETINKNFISPIVFCDKDIIRVGFFKDNSDAENKKTFCSKNIAQSIEMTKKLLPKDILKAINPLAN